ncbi:MAG: haloacid dehalogenase [Armatimonadota bacterium]
MRELERIATKVRAALDRLDGARERAYRVSRDIVRRSADTIRAVHRSEFEAARSALDETNQAVRAMREAVAPHPQLAAAGFVQDAQKEHAEAQITYALIAGHEIPDPDEIGVAYAPYLNGAAEAVGELRRYVVDSIRLGRLDRSEAILNAMDDIYYALVTFDYPDAISLGLRRRTDAVRSIIEHTRADLTRALRQRQLQESMRALEERLGSSGDETRTA